MQIKEIKEILQNENDAKLKKILYCSLIKTFEKAPKIKRENLKKNFPFLKKHSIKNINKLLLDKLHLDKSYKELFEHELGIDKKKLKLNKSDSKILIIGGGISGITSYYFLKMYFKNVSIFEKQKKAGGTWFMNNYPGARVDVANKMYCFSFNQDFNFKNIYSNRSQMLKYIDSTIKKIGMNKNLAKNTEVKEIHFKNRQWTVKYFFQNKEFIKKFDYIICATGQLSSPKKIHIKNYQGKIIHPYYWRKNEKINKKKVLMIGNAASAVQIATKIFNKIKCLDILYKSNNWFHYVKHYKKKTPSKLNYYFNNFKFFSNFYRLSNWENTNYGFIKQCSIKKDGSPKKESLIFKNNLKKYFKNYFGSNWETFVPNYLPGTKRILLDDGEWASLVKNKKVNLFKDTIKFAKGNKIFFNNKVSNKYDLVISAIGYETPKFFSNIIVKVDNKRIDTRINENPLTYCGIFTPSLPNFAFNYGPNTNGVVNGNTIFFSEVQSKFYSNIFYLFSKKKIAFKIKKNVAKKMQNKVNKGNKQMTWANNQESSWYKNKKGFVTQNWPFSLKDYWIYCKKLKIKDFENIK